MQVNAFKNIFSSENNYTSLEQEIANLDNFISYINSHGKSLRAAIAAEESSSRKLLLESKALSHYRDIIAQKSPKNLEKKKNTLKLWLVDYTGIPLNDEFWEDEERVTDKFDEAERKRIEKGDDSTVDGREIKTSKATEGAQKLKEQKTALKNTFLEIQRTSVVDSIARLNTGGGEPKEKDVEGLREALTDPDTSNQMLSIFDAYGSNIEQGTENALNLVSLTKPKVREVVDSAANRMANERNISRQEARKVILKDISEKAMRSIPPSNKTNSITDNRQRTSAALDIAFNKSTREKAVQKATTTKTKSIQSQQTSSYSTTETVVGALGGSESLKAAFRKAGEMETKAGAEYLKQEFQKSGNPLPGDTQAEKLAQVAKNPNDSQAIQKVVESTLDIEIKENATVEDLEKAIKSSRDTSLSLGNEAKEVAQAINTASKKHQVEVKQKQKTEAKKQKSVKNQAKAVQKSTLTIAATSTGKEKLSPNDEAQILDAANNVAENKETPEIVISLVQEKTGLDRKNAETVSSKIINLSQAKTEEDVQEVVAKTVSESTNKAPISREKIVNIAEIAAKDEATAKQALIDEGVDQDVASSFVQMSVPLATTSGRKTQDIDDETVDKVADILGGSSNKEETIDKITAVYKKKGFSDEKARKTAEDVAIANEALKPEATAQQQLSLLTKTTDNQKHQVLGTPKPSDSLPSSVKNVLEDDIKQSNPVYGAASVATHETLLKNSKVTDSKEILQAIRIGNQSVAAIPSGQKPSVDDKADLATRYQNELKISRPKANKLANSFFENYEDNFDKINQQGGFNKDQAKAIADMASKSDIPGFGAPMGRLIQTQIGSRQGATENTAKDLLEKPMNGLLAELGAEPLEDSNYKVAALSVSQDWQNASIVASGSSALLGTTVFDPDEIDWKSMQSLNAAVDKDDSVLLEVADASRLAKGLNIPGYDPEALKTDPELLKDFSSMLNGVENQENSVVSAFGLTYNSIEKDVLRFQNPETYTSEGGGFFQRLNNTPVLGNWIKTSFAPKQKFLSWVIFQTKTVAISTSGGASVMTTYSTNNSGSFGTPGTYLNKNALNQSVGQKAMNAANVFSENLGVGGQGLDAGVGGGGSPAQSLRGLAKSAIKTGQNLIKKGQQFMKAMQLAGSAIGAISTFITSMLPLLIAIFVVATLVAFFVFLISFLGPAVETRYTGDGYYTIEKRVQKINDCSDTTNVVSNSPSYEVLEISNEAFNNLESKCFLYTVTITRTATDENTQLDIQLAEDAFRIVSESGNQTISQSPRIVAYNDLSISSGEQKGLIPGSPFYENYPNVQTELTNEFTEVKFAYIVDFSATSDTRDFSDVPETIEDSYIENNFFVKVEIREGGSEQIDIIDSNAQAFISIGDAPEIVRLGNTVTVGGGCWPATGYVYQGPFAKPTHTVIDAIDIYGEMGSPIIAPFAGSVKFHDNSDRYADYEPQDETIHGYHAVLTMEGGKRLLFSHMLGFVDGHQAGDVINVEAGTQIGYMGNTGRNMQTEIHLHYELLGNEGSGPSDLVNYVPGLELDNSPDRVDDTQFVTIDSCETPLSESLLPDHSFGDGEVF